MAHCWMRKFWRMCTCFSRADKPLCLSMQILRMEAVPEVFAGLVLTGPHWLSLNLQRLRIRLIRRSCPPLKKKPAEPSGANLRAQNENCVCLYQLLHSSLVEVLEFYVISDDK